MMGRPKCRGMGESSSMKLVFVHGAGGGPYSWYRQKDYFGDRADPVALPGHPSGKGENRIAPYVAWLKEYIGRQGYQEVVLVGHSMGGAVTQAIALERPNWLKAIVLVGTGARLRVLPAIFEELKTDYEAYIEHSVTRGAASLTPEDVERRRAWLRQMDPMVIHGDFEACDKFDIMNDVSRITLPTLIIVGRDDQMTPVKYAEYLHQKIAGSRLVIVEGAGHAVPMEKPDEVNRAIDDFVQAVLPASTR